MIFFILLYKLKMGASSSIVNNNTDWIEIEPISLQSSNIYEYEYELDYIYIFEYIYMHEHI